MPRPTLERHLLQHPDGRRFVVYGHLEGDLDGAPSVDATCRTSLQRRFDRSTGAWVLISPSRNQRPGGILGGADTAPCLLCPGGLELPFEFQLAVFDNRFPALAPDAPAPDGPLAAASLGHCQVLVYTSDHDCRALTDLAPSQLVALVAVLRERTTELWDEGHDYVMAFENRGAEVGATLNHLHGQLYAIGHLPPVIATKRAQLESHRRGEHRCLGCTLVDEEIGTRIVDNDTFSIAVPTAPRWPYEVHVRARRHGLRRLGDLSNTEVIDLAGALHDVVVRYDALYSRPLPYMMCVQEAPNGAGNDWHLHIEFLPPHRDADRLKVRASVETALGLFINDTVPEISATRLAGLDVGARRWHELDVPTIVDAPIRR